MMLIFDKGDAILREWKKSTNALVVEKEKVSEYALSYPVAFRGMTKIDVFQNCKNTGRDFYYIDTGYLGNLNKRKEYHRVVKNNVQHTTPIELPSDRWDTLERNVRHPIYSKSWRSGSKILIVTPSEKPCRFYGITRDAWVKNTLTVLKQHTDREIVIRDKPIRQDRVGTQSIYKQFVEDDIYAVVTYNSIAATEAVAFGIPAFADAPVNAAKSVSLSNFTKIEDPFYPSRDQVAKWLHWLSYCQYTVSEISSGKAYRIQQEYNLC